MTDSIIIEELELFPLIGVPDKERALPQRVTAHVVYTLRHDFTHLQDDIEKTIDYSEVCNTIREITGLKPYRLLETLGTEIAEAVFHRFPISSICIELRKFIIPDTRYVAVKLLRRGPQ